MQLEVFNLDNAGGFWNFDDMFAVLRKDVSFIEHSLEGDFCLPAGMESKVDPALTGLLPKVKSFSKLLVDYNLSDDHNTTLFLDTAEKGSGWANVLNVKALMLSPISIRKRKRKITPVWIRRCPVSQTHVRWTSK